jgi:hypothetical protein
MHQRLYYPHLASLLRDITFTVIRAKLHRVSNTRGIICSHWNIDTIQATVCGMPVVDLQGVTSGWYLKPSRTEH